MVRTILSSIRFSPLPSPIPLIDGLPPRTCVHLVPLLPLISQRGLARSQALCILLRTLVEMAGQSQPRTIALTGFDAAATDARMLNHPQKGASRPKDRPMQNHHPIPRTSMHDVWLGHSAPRAGCINDATPSHQSPAILGVSRLAVEVGNTDQIIQMA